MTGTLHCLPMIYDAMLGGPMEACGRPINKEYTSIVAYLAHKRMEFPDIIERAKQVSFALGNGYPTDILVEEVQSQVYIAHELINQGLPASGIKIHGSDKRHRLMMTTHLIRSGKVLFPRKGAEELIEQIVHFGVERHDDLVDAFTMLILQVTAERRMAQPEVFVLKSRPLRLGRRSSFWDDDDE